MRLSPSACALALLVPVVLAEAQAPPAPPAAPAAPAAPAQRAEPPRRRAGHGEPEFDPEAVRRGQELLVARCGFCHGSNARGGSGGPDLTRSVIVQEDENGQQLDAFLKVGRPDRNMPKFELSSQELTDLATFLHATIYQLANRDTYQILDILTGDANAGAAFFNGKGGCRSCHSPTGDLKGVGAKYDPATLQLRMLMPPRGSRRERDSAPAYLEPNALKATVTPASGPAATGVLVRLTDFDVTLYDPASGQLRSWLRTDGVPSVAVTDPLQGHVDLWRKWTDDDLHNATRYLATLKQ
jgi:cytochrome c oxidase cbb3-type subunit III